MFNIAINTFREIIRNKFLYLIGFFGLLLIIFSISLGKLTLGEDARVIVNFGLSMIEIFGLIGVLFVGSQLLFKEIDGKTIFLILSKPIKRHDFIIGKFLGFIMVLSIIVLFETFIFLGVLLFSGIEISIFILLSIFFIYLKLITLIGLVLFFSTFMSTILTILVSFLLYFVSHSFGLLIEMFTRLDISFLLYFIKTLQVLFPPFEALNLKDYIGYDIKFTNFYYIINSIYSIFYIFVILFLTSVIFNNKKFEN
ncbi:MAG: ABC transporter permease [Candidatus Gracilibacteria bacterium]|nr:ABC transporter permease [Candidatus Gracilibacteria bacterium]